MKVLIIDDEELVRKSLSRAFRSRNHEVVEAAGGVEGQSLWESEKPDLIFIDVLMPDINGPKVIENMQGRTSSRIILMSAYTGGYDLNKAKSLGADLFIPKPFENIFDTIKVAEDLIGIGRSATKS